LRATARGDGMGRHVDEFMRLYHNGQIVGDHVVASMAEQAIHADKAEADAARRRRAGRELSDDEYEALWPPSQER
jgi:hypothetical protein